MSTQKTISICIPTYNGAKVIAKTLDSIIQDAAKIENINENIEIVLTDDCSSDETLSVVSAYAAKYEYIKIFKNEKNLGMDGNFKQAALNSSGEYVWFSGQDDIFLSGSISHILGVIKNNKNLGVIYVNYSQYSEDLLKNICDSMFHQQVFEPEKIDFNRDIFFENGSEYFKFFLDAPTFLPATIMKRAYWFNTNTDEFMGTHYIQYANVLINMRHCQIAAVARPYIKGIIPTDSWSKNGRFLYSVILGNMKAQTIIFRNYPGGLPEHIYFKKRRHFIISFFPLVLAAKLGGLKLSDRKQNSLKYIFGGIFYYLYFLPLLFFANLFSNNLIKILKNLKHNRCNISRVQK